MRTIQILTLALLATAARADVQPCSLTLLGNGLVCTEGLLTFALSSNAPPDTIVEPIPGGLQLVGQMDGNDQATYFLLEVTVPAYTKIVGLPGGVTISYLDFALGATDAGIATTIWASGGTYAGLLLDDINAMLHTSPGPGGGISDTQRLNPDNIQGLTDQAIDTVEISSHTYGGPSTMERWAIGGFDAVTPEPSAFLLLATALALVWHARRRRAAC